MTTTRQILFSTPMVQALLDGRKTQTRRIVKPQPEPNKPHDGGTSWHYGKETGLWHPFGTVGHLDLVHKMGIRCPYGRPGDLVYVRETLTKSGAFIQYAADYKVTRELWPDEWKQDPRPSIHMPRRLSRLTLKLIDVRVQQLQEISDADAIAEGIADLSLADATLYGLPGEDLYAQHPVRAYQLLWNSINGPGAWSRNEWVWALTFEAIAKNVDQVIREVEAV